MNQVLNEAINRMKEEIIHATCDMINIPSVLDHQDGSSTPFGENTVKALEYMLNLGKRFGFRTKNIDHYCGYIECGEGEKLLGIIGHLDVVPADDTWTFKPFQATISHDCIYGRGAIDDKGPTVAALYAMKAVAETYPLNKRVRLILGLNEENDWKCIEHYKKTEELPSVAFSPDANFPCIYAEKNIETLYLKQHYEPKDSFVIESISTNNNAINVVPKYAEVTLRFDPYKMPAILTVVQKILSASPYTVTVEKIDSSHIKLISLGKASHAAHPELGENALSKLLIVLHDLFCYYHFHLPILDFFVTYIGNDFTGKDLGIDYQDESGCLTLNTAQFIQKDDSLQIGFNLRIPVTIDFHQIEEQFQKYCPKNVEIEVTKIQKPLNFKKEDPLVQTLCHIFNDYYQSDLEPEAIGGGTYARAFDHCISFGPQMPGAKDMCHQSDELIRIDNLLFCAKVYAEAILEL